MPTETPDPVEPVRRGPLRRRPPMWAALLTGAFAVFVYAATDTVLRLVDDQSESAPAGGAPTSQGSAPAGSAPAGGAPSSAPSSPGGAPATPGSPPADGTPPATQDPAAKNESSADDTNLEEEADGPRRAAPARPSDEEAPEFRESADNNISLPVDI